MRSISRREKVLMTGRPCGQVGGRAGGFHLRKQRLDLRGRQSIPGLDRALAGPLQYLIAPGFQRRGAEAGKAGDDIHEARRRFGVTVDMRHGAYLQIALADGEMS